VLTDKVNKNLDKYKKYIDRRVLYSRTCLIKMSANTDDVFEIVPIINLKLGSVYEDITVIGIAESRGAAIDLCAGMAKFYLESESDLSMRQFFTDMLLE